MPRAANTVFQREGIRPQLLGEAKFPLTKNGVLGISFLIVMKEVGAVKLNAASTDKPKKTAGLAVTMRLKKGHRSGTDWW